MIKRFSHRGNANMLGGLTAKGHISTPPYILHVSAELISLPQSSARQPHSGSAKLYLKRTGHSLNDTSRIRDTVREGNRADHKSYQRRPRKTAHTSSHGIGSALRGSAGSRRYPWGGC